MTLDASARTHPPARTKGSPTAALPARPALPPVRAACDIYKTKKGFGGSRIDYARYKLGAMGFKIEYYIKHM